MNLNNIRLETEMSASSSSQLISHTVSPDEASIARALASIRGSPKSKLSLVSFKKKPEDLASLLSAKLSRLSISRDPILKDLIDLAQAEDLDHVLDRDLLEKFARYLQSANMGQQ